jgi:hypothetical protein
VASLAGFAASIASVLATFDPEIDITKRPVERILDRVTPESSRESNAAALPIIFGIVGGVIVVLAVILVIRNQQFKKRQAAALNRPYANPPPSERE